MIRTFKGDSYGLTVTAFQTMILQMLKKWEQIFRLKKIDLS